MVTLKPHQTKAIEDLRAKGGVALLRGEAGCGKTYIAGEYLRLILSRHGGNALYVTQATAIKEQVNKLSLFGLSVAHVKDFTEPMPQVCVVSHEGLRNSEKSIQEIKWTAVVCDEMHKMEAATKPTAQALIGDYRSRGTTAPFRLGMTATPIANGLKDCFSYLKWLHPSCPWKSATAFRNECLQPHPKVEHQWVGVWPNKFDYVNDLYNSVAVDVDYHPSYVKPIVEQVKVRLSAEERTAYDQIKEQGLIELEGKETVILANLMVIDGKLRQFVAHPYSLGYGISSSKEAALMSILGKVAGKTIVFCNHKSVLNVLHNRHGWPMIAGGVSMNKRHEILASAPDVLLMSAAGEASLDCQRYQNVVNYDLPWHNGHLDQRNGRVAREGQDKQVHVYYITAVDTVDEHVSSVVARKFKENLKVRNYAARRKSNKGNP